MSDHRIFLSHATADQLLAKELKVALKQDVGVDCFLLHEDAPSNSDWLEQIKEGLAKCESIITLITPRSVGRSWLAAEWACFALRDRPWRPLRFKVDRSSIWEPLLKNFDTDLSLATSVESLLRDLAQKSGQKPASGFRVAADTLIKGIEDAYQLAEQRDVDGALHSLKKNSRPGTDNISFEAVQTVLAAGRISEVLDVFAESEGADVKRKQLAVSLVKLTRLGDALKICQFMGNRAEIKNVALAAVALTPERAPEDSEEWRFLIAVYALLGEPQHRVVRARMDELGLPPRGPWGD